MAREFFPQPKSLRNIKEELLQYREKSLLFIEAECGIIFIISFV